MAYKAVLRILRKEARRFYQEDVLTASVFGALEYGPPEMAQDWLRDCAGIEGAGSDLLFEFWPTHHLADGSEVLPDVCVTDRRSGHLLVIEAKVGKNPDLKKLRPEGQAARHEHPAAVMHLLTISNRTVRPTAFSEIRRDLPDLFASMRHITWADMHVFLEQWLAGHDLNMGQRRLIEDAVAVIEMERLEPFSGLQKPEIRAMKRERRWMQELPRQLGKLHGDLSRRLDGLDPPLSPQGNLVTTNKVGSLSYDRPEEWFPREFTLRYGASADAKKGDRYFCVRAVLKPPQIWVGYALPPDRVLALLEDQAAVAKLVNSASKLVKVYAVTPKGQPFEILAGPLVLSASGLREAAKPPGKFEVNLVRVFPMTVLSETGTVLKIGDALEKLVVACRAVRALGAPGSVRPRKRVVGGGTR